MTPAIALAAALVCPAEARVALRLPDLRGVWNPGVGAGSVYRVDRPAGKGEMGLAVVGQEAVDDKPGTPRDCDPAGMMPRLRQARRVASFPA